jgi:HAD superfamily hydrolase (TIGR01509 family)
VLALEANTRYAAWLVDLDGTLYRHTPVKLAMAAELLLFGWSAIRTLRTFRHAHEALRQNPASGALALSPYQRQIAHAAERLGCPTAQVEGVVREWMFERPLKWVVRARRQPLLDALAAFRAQGGKTALVSDYPASGKLRALRARDLFDVVISSGEAGGPSKLKPDPEGYLSAATRLGIEPARCLVIGDRDDADGQAARAAGMGLHLIR